MTEIDQLIDAFESEPPHSLAESTSLQLNVQDQYNIMTQVFGFQQAVRDIQWHDPDLTRNTPMSLE